MLLSPSCFMERYHVPSVLILSPPERSGVCCYVLSSKVVPERNAIIRRHKGNIFVRAGENGGGYFLHGSCPPHREGRGGSLRSVGVGLL